MLAAVHERPITRRALLRGAAGGTAALTVTGLPAWARPVAGRATAIRRPDSLPFPHLPAGHASMPEIEHIVVLMMENHSFDNILGMLAHEVAGRGDVDGLTVRGGRVRDVNRDSAGRPVYAQRAPSPCQLPRKPSQTWNASHEAYDNGRNDGFVRASGDSAMWYWDKRDLPFTYALAERFPIGQRYFCSVLAQTYPNRRFLFAGTASGTVSTSGSTFGVRAANGTIFERLDAHKISYGVYYQDAPSPLILPNFSGNPLEVAHVHTIEHFYQDAAAGRLPAVTLLDPNYTTTSEENPQDIQVGEQFVAHITQAILRSPRWRNTALFITYDEHGGYYDHVPPPRAIKPDAIAPDIGSGDARGGYDRYGFRVPLIVVSPWARPSYVSNVVQDHTSITAFIERKWNLPAMTFRDANAQPMTDYFDFRRPAFLHPPRLPGAPRLAPGFARCDAQGLKPPLPSSS
jgi:phospholipase C